MLYFSNSVDLSWRWLPIIFITIKPIVNAFLSHFFSSPLTMYNNGKTYSSLLLWILIDWNIEIMWISLESNESQFLIFKPTASKAKFVHRLQEFFSGFLLKTIYPQNKSRKQTLPPGAQPEGNCRKDSGSLVVLVANGILYWLLGLKQYV